jgi:uncharacterized protein YodC (DUF2158 family)
LVIKAASKEAAFLCPWMDGIPQGAKDGGVVCPWMDGIPQGAKDGGVVICREGRKKR